MLNDISTPVRLMVGVFGFAAGVMLGGPVAGAGAAVVAVVILLAAVVELALVVAMPVFFARADRRFVAELEQGTGEIARGEVTPRPAIGRVVRQRPAQVPSWGPARGALPPPTGVTVLTAVGDGPARRVAALVPRDLDLHHREVPALLLLHPDRPEVAVLDDRATYDALQQVHTDPRWTSERLPSDRTVVGGYAVLLLALVGGGAVGVGLSVLVLSLTG